MKDILIRKITADEVDCAMALALEVFMQFEAPDYGPAGVETFRKDIVENPEYLENARIYDPCYAATAVLSETFGQDNHPWLEIYRDIIWGYDSVAHLTEAERKAIPCIILANQFVCVAWFAEQDRYAELFEVNKKMTAWLIENLEELKNI